jgi:hypothetical protein
MVEFDGRIYGVRMTNVAPASGTIFETTDRERMFHRQVFGFEN